MLVVNTDRIKCDKLGIKSYDVSGLRQLVLLQWNKRDGLTTRRY